MAKQRYINTKFWSDNWVSNLDPIEKLLFLYLICNERTNIAGIYELPLKYMSVETGIEKEMIVKILSRFQKDNKVLTHNGWVFIKNFQKHQDISNEKIKKGIEVVIKQIPQEILDNLYNNNSLSIGYAYPSNYSNTNSNTNSNILANSNEFADKINKIINEFKKLNPSYKKLFANKTQRQAISRLLKEHNEAGIISFIDLADIANKDKYSGVSIITPLQLEDNLGKLRNYVFKSNNENKKQQKIYDSTI